MRELTKSIQRRIRDPLFTLDIFRGDGIDIGSGDDGLEAYVHLFPKLTSVCPWDVEDGDAQGMADIADDLYNFVHSSHCLEHLVDPFEAIQNWVRILRPGGYLVFTVPDEDLYEQGVWPATWNEDHKWTFTIFKAESWSPKSVNILGLISMLGDAVETLRITQLGDIYPHHHERYDKSCNPLIEPAIEVILRKRRPEEIDRHGRYPGGGK